MLSHIFKFFLVFQFTLLSFLGLSQWLQTDGPYGETKVSFLNRFDSVLLASSSCGIFTKSSSTNQWKMLSTTNISSGVKHHKLIFLGSSSGLFSLDLSLKNPSVNSVESMPVLDLEQADTALFVASETSGFMFSKDEGLSWMSLNNGLPRDTFSSPMGNYYLNRVNSIATTSNAIFSATRKGLYKLNANQKFWEILNNGLPQKNTTLVKNLSDSIFAIQDSSLYLSNDFGASWRLVFHTSSLITDVHIVGNHLFVSTFGNGIFESKFLKYNWLPYNSGLVDLKITTLSDLNSDLFCGTFKNGVQTVSNAYWNQNNLGMICSSIIKLKATNSGLVAADRRNLFQSLDAQQWQNLNSPNIPYYENLSSGIGSILTSGDTVIMSYNYCTPSWPFFYSLIQYSSDYGDSWKLIPSPSYVGDDPYRMVLEDKRLFVFEDDKLFYTDDLGISWIEASLPSQYCNMFYDYTTHNGNYYAAACGGGQLLKNVNNTWVLSNNGFPSNREPTALISTKDALFAKVNFEGMYVSYDEGYYWGVANNGLDKEAYVLNYSFKNDVLYVCFSNGIFYTKDLGKNWYPLKQFPFDLMAQSIFVDDNFIYAGTINNGVWKIAVQDTELSLHEQTKEKLTIYPNPSTELIQINSEINFESYEITDLLGKLIAKGLFYNKTFEIPLAKIPNGEYFVILADKNAKYVEKFCVLNQNK